MPCLPRYIRSSRFWQLIYLLIQFQGYLSFWNDNISYALRGCIVIELAFRGRVSMQRDPQRKRFPLADRVIEVVDDTLTGEVLLDEALKMMKSSEKMSVSSWIDLMSGTLCPKIPITHKASYHDFSCPDADAT